MRALKGLERVSSVDLLAEGLLTVRNRLCDTQERISEVDGTLHELMAYESRLKRVIKMQQAITGGKRMNSEPDRYGYCEMTDCNNNATWLWNGLCKECQG